MKVILASTSKIKISVLRSVYDSDGLDLRQSIVNPMVNQPFGIHNTVLAALHRINQFRDDDDVVALENGIVRNADTSLLEDFAICIMRKDGKYRLCINDKHVVPCPEYALGPYEKYIGKCVDDETGFDITMGQFIEQEYGYAPNNWQKDVTGGKISRHLQLRHALLGIDRSDEFLSSKELTDYVKHNY